MHYWGDEGVDWAGIENAAYWIGKQLRRWGRIYVSQTKEKYGEARVYCSFGRYEWPSWINTVLIPYQQWVYRVVYSRALKKWPHLKQEILMGADWRELLIPISEGKLVLKQEEGYTTIGWKGDTNVTD